MKLTRQYRKLKNIYLKVAVAACLFVIFVILRIYVFQQ